MGEIVKNHPYSRWTCKHCSTKYEKQGMFLGPSSEWADKYCSEQCWQASGAAPSKSSSGSSGGSGGSPSASSARGGSSGPGLFVGAIVAMNRKSNRDLKALGLWCLAIVAWPFELKEETQLQFYGPKVGRLTTKHRRIVLGIVAPILLVLFLMK